MQPKALRLFAKGEALLPVFEKLGKGVRQFVGRKYEEVEPGVFGFVPTKEPSEVSRNGEFRSEYAEAVRNGDAEPADEETARACGVKWIHAKAATTEKKGAA